MGVFDYINGDDTVMENEPLETLAADQELAVWPHKGFWAAMDTLRDKRQLEKLWSDDEAPWKTWP